MAVCKFLSKTEHTNRLHNYRCAARSQLVARHPLQHASGRQGSKPTVATTMNDNAKIGTALSGLGCLFIVLGVVFFFDRMFLSLGNAMFLGGLLLTMGVSRPSASS